MKRILSQDLKPGDLIYLNFDNDLKIHSLNISDGDFLRKDLIFVSSIVIDVIQSGYNFDNKDSFYVKTNLGFFYCPTSWKVLKIND